MLVLEDLAYNLELEEVRDLFSSVVQRYRDLCDENKVYPAEHPIDIQHNLRNIGIQMHSDTLYDKDLTYKASLLRKCTKLYRETAITVNDLQVK